MRRGRRYEVCGLLPDNPSATIVFARELGSPEFAWDVRRALRETTTSILARRHAPALLEHILRTRNATAWVVYNDEVGVTALEFLRRKGVRLPEQLSLVGFDNTLEGYRLGLSSYDFNAPAIVNALLEHILAPKRAGPRALGAKIRGMVLERRTSGAANA